MDIHEECMKHFDRQHHESPEPQEEEYTLKQWLKEWPDLGDEHDHGRRETLIQIFLLNSRVQGELIDFLASRGAGWDAYAEFMAEIEHPEVVKAFEEFKAEREDVVNGDDAGFSLDQDRDAQAREMNRKGAR